MSGISAHDLIFVTYIIAFFAHPTLEVFEFRDYSEINFDQLYSAAQYSNWSGCEDLQSVDDKCSHFSRILYTLFDEHVPKKVFTISNNQNMFSFQSKQ